VRGFDAAFEAACGAVAVSGIDSGGALPGREQRPQALASSWLLQLPQAVQEVAHLGRARVLEYQDAHYAELYESRLHRIAQAEREADPHARSGMATTRETARHLALWMAFDDIVRVAELKIRSARISRVRAEVGARDGEVLRIYDHFKPTVAEVAAILPRSLAAALTRWDRRRQSRGRSPLAMALKLPTHSIVGMAALRLLVALKPLRPRSSRFHDEQELIERWLVAIEQGVRQSTGLGLELAECGRLIKGYGSTHDRGKDILLHVIATLAGGASTDGVDARTAAVRAARLAALADDTGNALNLTMVRHGAAPMPTREHPVQWVRRRPGGRAGAAQRASTPDRGARP
jgi:indolepyruvate ferredoxin oxidoreductase beta subunit